MAGVMNKGKEHEAIDASTEIVSERDRASKGSLTMAWWGVCSAMFYIVVGVAMAKSYGTINAIIGLVITVIAYGIINGIISKYAIETGLSVGLFSRVLFGSKGAALATLILSLYAILCKLPSSQMAA